MQRFPKIVVTCLAVLCTAILFGSVVFAKSVEQPPGEPPHGVAIQSDAQGTKLNGVLAIEYHDIGETTAAATVVMRLRKGNELKIFFAELGGVAFPPEATAIQTLITEALEDQILAAFFPGDTTLAVVLKSLTEFIDSQGADALFVIADVVLAVK